MTQGEQKDAGSLGTAERQGQRLASSKSEGTVSTHMVLLTLE